MQSEETWMELHALHRHGWSIADLAREFGLNWRTAKKYATAERSRPATARGRDRPSSRAAQLAHVERRLTACPDLRATVLLRELADEYGYTGLVREPAPAGRRPPPGDRGGAGAALRDRTRRADPGRLGRCRHLAAGRGDRGRCSPSWRSSAARGWSRSASRSTRRAPTTLRSIVRCVDDLGGATADFLTRPGHGTHGGNPRRRRARSTRPSGSTSRPCWGRVRGPAGRTGPRPRARSSG